MRVPLLLVADSANFSLEGKLNILGIFDQIFAPNFPANHPQMSLVLRIEIEDEDPGNSYEFRVELLSPEKKVLIGGTSPVTLPSEIPPGTLLPQILPFTNIQFEGPGDYTWQILINDQVKATISFKILPVPTQQGG